MKYLFLILFLLPLSTQAKEGVFIVSELVEQCTQCSENEDSSDCSFCNGIITGAATALVVEQQKITGGHPDFCPPANMDTKMARDSFRRWALNNRKNESLQAVDGVLASLKSGFPCKK